MPRRLATPGGEVLHGHVGLPGEVADDLACLGPTEIEADALLAHVDPREVRALIVAARVELEMALAHVVAAALALDLDHARAEIGQETRAIRPGEHAGEVEDDEICEWRHRIGHRASIAEGSTCR